jgi:hypothetical protein
MAPAFFLKGGAAHLHPGEVFLAVCLHLATANRAESFEGRRDRNHCYPSIIIVSISAIKCLHSIWIQKYPDDILKGDSAASCAIHSPGRCPTTAKRHPAP